MTEPIANLNGQWVPQSQAVISVTDGGFVQGVTVAEQLRTFNGQLFELPRHLKRLARSLEIVGIDPGVTLAELESRARELAARNHALLQPGDDLGLSMFVTPGIYGTFVAAGGHSGPTIGMHTYPLPFGSWVNKYEQGEALVLTDVRQVPNDCWPAELKCRSRMHYYLADRRARQIEPGARAVMLDERGFVLEASTANLLIYRQREGIVSPPRASILPGVSVAILAELAAELSIPWSERDLTVADLSTADEILLCSTSPCVWPVTRFAGQAVSRGKPGPIARQLRAAFSNRVGLDIAAQAVRFATRS
ncbi:aminotransferase class IV [Anatilimnocola sp. NA78]|uniref:aminotransferase class IV n=1 Tax=Anatilimnocola sp. NA78 TaxID=3415683 RepID=UPI003CE5062D